MRGGEQRYSVYGKPVNVFLFHVFKIEFYKVIEGWSFTAITFAYISLHSHFSRCLRQKSFSPDLTPRNVYLFFDHKSAYYRRSYVSMFR